MLSEKESIKYPPASMSTGANAQPGSKRSARSYLVDPDVREVRHEYGLSQDKFSRLMGIGVKSLGDWEEGRRRPELLACILLRVATRVHPRVFLASWLGATLIVVVAQRVHHHGELFVFVYDLFGLLFGFVAGLSFMIAILALRRRGISQATLGLYCGLSGAGIFVAGCRLFWGFPLDEYETLLLLIVGTTAGILSTILGCRTSHRA